MNTSIDTRVDLTGDLVGAAALTRARRSASNCGTRVVLRNPTLEVTRSLRVTDAIE